MIVAPAQTARCMPACTVAAPNSVVMAIASLRAARAAPVQWCATLVPIARLFIAKGALVLSAVLQGRPARLPSARAATAMYFSNDIERASPLVHRHAHRDPARLMGHRLTRPMQSGSIRSHPVGSPTPAMPPGDIVSSSGALVGLRVRDMRVGRPGHVPDAQ